MNIHSKSGMKCSKQYGNKRADNVEEAPVKKCMRSDTEVDPLKITSESRFSGHSTPISRKGYTFDIEDSPEFDYHCSPISLPCTQDGNEVAWDWQVPTTKSSNEKYKPQANLVETPKRTKQLQKKRNSNSPLLQKPLKRKQMRMQNIESIGKLTAELKALTEKMKSLQENNDVQVEQQSKLLIELDSEDDEDVLEIDINNDKHMLEPITVGNNDNKNTNYEDLFDDSIEDSMVKCSQEIEEKLKINKSKGNGMELSILKEEVEMSSEKEVQYSTTSSNSAVSFKNSTMSKSSSSVNINSHLKTYSNNSSKTSSNSSISNSKDTNTRKSLLNNNILNVPNGEYVLQKKDLSDFPDDSFDDCLATCVEDDKLSKLSEYDFNGSNTDYNLNCSKITSRQTTSTVIKNMRPPNNSVPKPLNTGSVCNKTNSNENSKFFIDDLGETTAVNRNEVIQKLLPGNNVLENRKFFKTKSLSDQLFYRGRNSNAINKISKPVAPSDTFFESDMDGSSVSTSFPVTKNRQLYDSNNLPSNSGAGSVCTLNRLEEDEENSIVKYKSTSNLSSIREISKVTQSVQCTPEEIERKRLEAKMRLEAKRKLLQNVLPGTTSSEVPVKKCVKR